MEKDMIITLDDNTEYALLDETEVDGTKYFFAAKLDEEGNPTNDFDVFEEYTEDGEVFMDTIEDETLKKALLVDFSNNYLNTVTDMMLEEEETGE